MTGLGIQTWVLSLIGIRATLSHREYLEILEVLRILCNSYRLASLGAGSTVICGRFTFDFCRIIAAGTARNLASRQSVQQAIGSIRIRIVTANVGPRRASPDVEGKAEAHRLRDFRRNEQRRAAGECCEPSRSILRG